MNSLTVNSSEAPKLRDIWALFLTSGIAMIVLAVLLESISLMSTLSMILRFGLLLAVGAVVQICSALWARHSQSFILHLLPGIIYLIVGILLLDQSQQAVASVTLLCSASLMVNGVFRIIVAMTNRVDHSKWVWITGSISLLLGVSIWWQWPVMGLWAIGACLGIEMLICGWDWIWLGLTVRKLNPVSR